MIEVRTSEVNLEKALEAYFGYTSFRGKQKEVIETILKGHHTFVIMPTGAGKSLCFQLPALLMEGVAVVISPLIALMKNQVDQMQARDIPAYFLNSSMSPQEANAVKKAVISNQAKLLYLAPETFVKEETIQLLREARISFLAVDEAHCISEWGHDFRPEYRQIYPTLQQIRPNVPIMALTATATPKVQLDVQQNLHIEDAIVFKTSFNRPNLYYEIRPKVKPIEQIVKYIKQNPGKSGIVYCLSRKTTEKIAEILRLNGIKAEPYHAGMSAEQRNLNQDKFLNEEIQVIVATIAFGMGIDKPDVRFVIHYDTPKTIENYYQETGRAGRDGREGNCILFYDTNDLHKLEKFLKDKPLSEREAGLHLIFEMAAFCESGICRRKQILHYFGESFDERDCHGMCDNCRYPKEKFNGTEEAKLILSLVAKTGERFDMKHLIKILLGVKNQQINAHKHYNLPEFGKGTYLDEYAWKSIFTQLLVYDYLIKDIHDYGVIKLSQKGEAFLKQNHPIYFFKVQDFEAIEREREEEASKVDESFTTYDPVLYDKLLKLRNQIAKEKGLPPYIVFQEASLEDMASRYPITLSEFEKIKGVGKGKALKFGKPFIELIRKYVEENDIERPEDYVVRTTANRSKQKMEVIQYIDRRTPLMEIARIQNLEFDELLDILEQIVYSGAKIDISYDFEELFSDPDKVEAIWEYFSNAQNDDIYEAERHLGPDYSLQEIRLVRIQFYAQHAN
jgi:ATP-dependent DNA helicase RecQ